MSLHTLKVVPSETNKDPEEDSGVILGPEVEGEGGEEEGGKVFAPAIVAAVAAAAAAPAAAALTGTCLQAPDAAADAPVAEPADEVVTTVKAGSLEEEEEACNEGGGKLSPPPKKLKTSIFATGTTPARVGMQPPNASPPLSEWPAILAGPVGLPWTSRDDEEEEAGEEEGSEELEEEEERFRFQVRVGRWSACASPKKPPAAGEPPETTSQGAASRRGCGEGAGARKPGLFFFIPVVVVA